MYDIVLMDVHMPIIDGLEASRRIRDTYSVEERPKIVALSADTTQVCPLTQTTVIGFRGIFIWKRNSCMRADPP